MKRTLRSRHLPSPRHHHAVSTVASANGASAHVASSPLWPLRRHREERLLEEARAKVEADKLAAAELARKTDELRRAYEEAMAAAEAGNGDEAAVAAAQAAWFQSNQLLESAQDQLRATEKSLSEQEAEATAAAEAGGEEDDDPNDQSAAARRRRREKKKKRGSAESGGGKPGMRRGKSSTGGGDGDVRWPVSIPRPPVVYKPRPVHTSSVPLTTTSLQTRPAHNSHYHSPELTRSRRAFAGRGRGG